MHGINDSVCYTTLTLDSGGLTKLHFLEYVNFKSRIKKLESQAKSVLTSWCSATEKLRFSSTIDSLPHGQKA